MYLESVQGESGDLDLLHCCALFMYPVSVNECPFVSVYVLVCVSISV